jgi:hypothetical protein
LETVVWSINEYPKFLWLPGRIFSINVEIEAEETKIRADKCTDCFDIQYEIKFWRGGQLVTRKKQKEKSALVWRTSLALFRNSFMICLYTIIKLGFLQPFLGVQAKEMLNLRETIGFAIASNISAKAQQVFIYLAWRSDRFGISFPSKATIARDCKISLRSVDYAIKELVEVGLIAKRNRKRPNTDEYTSNEYQILVPSCSANNTQPTADNAQPDQPDHVKVTQNVRTKKKDMFCLSNNKGSNDNKKNRVVVDPLLEFMKERGINVSLPTLARWRRKLSVSKILEYLRYAIEIVGAENPVGYVNAAVSYGFDPTQNRAAKTTVSAVSTTTAAINVSTYQSPTAPRKKVRSPYLERLRAGGAK